MRAVIIFSILIAVHLGHQSHAAGIETSGIMRNVDLRNCFQKNCLQMRAATAESGNFTPLMSLKYVTLDYYANGKKVSYSSLNGYIDYDRNVVLIKVSPKKEILFSLSDLTFKIYKL